jgi:hypothetical protein
VLAVCRSLPTVAQVHAHTTTVNMHVHAVNPSRVSLTNASLRLTWLQAALPRSGESHLLAQRLAHAARVGQTCVWSTRGVCWVPHEWLLVRANDVSATYGWSKLVKTDEQ